MIDASYNNHRRPFQIFYCIDLWSTGMNPKLIVHFDLIETQSG